MDIIAPFILVCIVLILFFFAFSIFYRFVHRKRAEQGSSSSKKDSGKRGDPGRCPLCNTKLASGEQLKSVVYAGGNQKDRVSHILGCPHCFPYMEADVQRSCPVCAQNVPAEGYLTGRLFLRPDCSRHLHITGCSECHKKKPGNS